MEYQYYDYNSLISSDDRTATCDNVKNLIKNGNYWTNSPKYQTNINVFGQSGAHWMKLKMSFITSAFSFLGKEVKIKGIQSWAFLTSLEYPEDRDMLWHNHNHNTSVESVSGIYYVKVPVTDLECGTEFAPDGPTEESRLILPPKEGQWLIYNSKEWHRPGILKSNEPRIIVAADLMY